MVSLKAIIPQLVIELKYASKNNFTKTVLYRHPDAFARLSVATALKKINAELSVKGIGLKVFDAYRPYQVTEKMWNLIHDERYVAEPTKGSGHNRGAAIDVTLIELATSTELPMPTGFDDFTEKAHHDYEDLPAEVRRNRLLLKSVMEKYGFVALPTEWWHYSLPKASEQFELLNLDFEQLSRLQKS